MKKNWMGVLTVCVLVMGLASHTTVLAQSEEIPLEETEVSAEVQEDTLSEEQTGDVQDAQVVNLTSESGLVMDVDTQTILYEKNGERPYYPASITKLLTALVVVENCSLDETVIFSHDAVYDVEDGSGNNQGFEAGDKLSVEECLYAMILESSNPAANALAEHTSGSLEEFVDVMNQRAEELGCKNSHFQNPSGLNDEEQQTTAYDMALISCAVFENEALREICSAQNYQLSPTLNQSEGYLLQMEHKLVNGEEAADSQWDFVGGKTGYTTMAGNTLVTYVEEEGKKLVSVVMKSDMTHYEDTKNLLDYGFENYDTLVRSDVQDDAPSYEETAVTQTQSQTSVDQQAAAESQEMDQKSAGILPMLKTAGYIVVGVLAAALLFAYWTYRRVQERRRKAFQARKRRQRELEIRRRQQEYHSLRSGRRSGRRTS